MSLPRTPALPIREIVDVGGTLSDPVRGAMLPVQTNRCAPLRSSEVILNLNRSQSEELWNLFDTKRGSVGWFQFNRNVLDGGADAWVFARFDSPTLEITWVRPGRYRARFKVKLRMDPLE